MVTAAPSPTIAVDRSDESSTTALYRAAVGSVNTHYYQLHFGRFEAADRAGASWNWAACLCTLNWMVFRQLWSAALVYAGALVGGPLLLFGIGRLVFQFSQETEWGLLAALVAALLLVPGLYGNAIFHAHCRKRMAAALAANTTLPEAVAMLNRQASTRQRLIWLMLANAVVVGAAVAAYLTFPGSAGSLPSEAPKAEARNVVVGRTTDAASGPVAAASAPVAAASAPMGVASAPTLPASAPSTMDAPTAAASAPAMANMASIATAAAAKPEVAGPASKAAASTAPTSKPAAKTKERKPATKPVSATQAAPAAKSTSASLHFVINVGLFAQEANARNTHTKLLDAGLVAFTQEIKTPKGKMTRVRVGPFDSQSDADAAVERIRSLGLDAILLQQ